MPSIQTDPLLVLCASPMSRSPLRSHLPGVPSGSCLCRQHEPQLVLKDREDDDGLCSVEPDDAKAKKLEGAPTTTRMLSRANGTQEMYRARPFQPHLFSELESLGGRTEGQCEECGRSTVASYHQATLPTVSSNLPSARTFGSWQPGDLMYSRSVALRHRLATALPFAGLQLSQPRYHYRYFSSFVKIYRRYPAISSFLCFFPAFFCCFWFASLLFFLYSYSYSGGIVMAHHRVAPHISFLLLALLVLLPRSAADAQTPHIELLPTPMILAEEEVPPELPLVVEDYTVIPEDCRDCQLHTTQYLLQIPEEATSVRIQLHPSAVTDVDLDLAVRMETPVAEDPDQFYFSFASATDSAPEEILIVRGDPQDSLAGAYFIAVITPHRVPAAFELRALVSVTAYPEHDAAAATMSFARFISDSGDYAFLHPSAWAPEAPTENNSLVEMSFRAPSTAYGTPVLTIGGWEASAEQHDPAILADHVLAIYADIGFDVVVAERYILLGGEPGYAASLGGASVAPALEMFACCIHDERVWMITLAVGHVLLLSLYEPIFGAVVEGFEFLDSGETPPASGDPVLSPPLTP